MRCFTALLLLSAPFVLAQTPPQGRSDSPGTDAPAAVQHLPLRKIILYKSGVGYFEHAGAVNGSRQVEIDLSSAQLNDVLQSLTALDLGGGRIVGASYNTGEPVAHQLAALPVSVAAAGSLLEFLQPLRGARMEVRTPNGGDFAGRLLVAESTTERQAGGTEIKALQVTLVNDSGELRQFVLGSAASMRFADPQLQHDLGQALGLLGASRSQQTRRLLLTAAGQGERQLQVSYISEVPIWKTTYRIVLPAAGAGGVSGEARLQGWAIVDNTVGEDWNNVQLALAAGAPQSFVQQLSQPYYAIRPVVPLPQQNQLAPETAQAGAMMSLSNDAPRSAPRGVTLLSAMASAQMPPPPPPPPPPFTTAQGELVGELFQYQLRDPVTIPQNHSAMVPILDAQVGVERVSLWHPGLARAVRALWLTNGAETLDGGSFEVVDGDAFGGEGIMDTVQPGERRLVSFATDLGLVVASASAAQPEIVSHISVARGVLVRSAEQRRRTTYTIRNADDTPRSVVVEHPLLQGGWELEPSPKPEETTASSARFRVAVAPHATANLVVEERLPGRSQFEISNLDDRTVQLWSEQRQIPAGLVASLQKVLAAKQALAQIASDAGAAQQQRDAMADDQTRLRDNLKALGNTPDQKALAARYVAELEQQETQLDALAQTIAGLRQRQRQAQQNLDALVQGLSFDADVAPVAAAATR
ncbi:MAG: DUF4139 domain-containing protein [Terriglobales bacterium]